MRCEGPERDVLRLVRRQICILPHQRFLSNSLNRTSASLSPVCSTEALFSSNARTFGMKHKIGYCALQKPTYPTSASHVSASEFHCLSSPI
jgi:hypothetical protein